MKELLGRYILMLHRDFLSYASKELESEGITQGLLYFIIYIGKCPNCSPKELCEGLNLDLGYGQRSLDKLVNEGFIIREKNAKDKRSYILSLSEKGEAVNQKGHEIFYQWDNNKFKNLSIEEKEQLLNLLEKLVKSGG